ncbi:Na+/H+ antiporter NhaD/arsenite permease-like protein [Methylopila capsulata]|uniref:Na+/H+ antiporter NhaD/arsenite permease-like protein n=1 Tax=Methylopila capsulata TaxID=61654 RepID=A0A9W6IUV6_9HYPH|nr:sodium:proton antiporter [Methylopila capsulata]MBM7852777.1 Na+/H+ antiporter NhaD/arsenite permease-like protein [Methylopila capsulata]GLK56987.1 sodium:proton antiporter [Methylopila capsulata]
MTVRPRRPLPPLAGLLALVLAVGLALWALSPWLATVIHGHVDGKALSLVWTLPLVGLLLSIAVMPLAAPHVWHHHYGKIAAGWALALLVPFAAVYGVGPVASETIHAALGEYLPFVVLLFSLFTISGGILVKGNLHGTPALNTALLAIGTLLASVIGTTGASMVLIRPLLRANDQRRRNAHVVIFFIFLVSNIGGSLTPLGDPPLFLGFLQGVDFFWTTTNVAKETAVLVAILLPAFYLLDRWFVSREPFIPKPDPTPDSRIGVAGLQNLPLLAGVVAAILMSGLWDSGVEFDVFGTHVTLQALLRDLILVGLALASLAITPRDLRESNGFDWEPIREVAKIFAAIFATLIPALLILKAGTEGAAAPLVALVSRPDGSPSDATYFWLTGILSSVLDNAPTYLVFFNLAGGDAQQLMGPLASTLAAISGGAVFMGALTYIGNAPNFMVLAIARNRGVAMPSFFGYMAWSWGVLGPCFVLLTLLFFEW